MRQTQRIILILMMLASFKARVVFRRNKYEERSTIHSRIRNHKAFNFDKTFNLKSYTKTMNQKKNTISWHRNANSPGENQPPIPPPPQDNEIIVDKPRKNGNGDKPALTLKTLFKGATKYLASSGGEVEVGRVAFCLTSYAMAQQVYQKFAFGPLGYGNSLEMFGVLLSVQRSCSDLKEYLAKESKACQLDAIQVLNAIGDFAPNRLQDTQSDSVNYNFKTALKQAFENCKANKIHVVDHDQVIEKVKKTLENQLKGDKAKIDQLGQVQNGDAFTKALIDEFSKLSEESFKEIGGGIAGLLDEISAAFGSFKSKTTPPE